MKKVYIIDIIRYYTNININLLDTMAIKQIVTELEKYDNEVLIVKDIVSKKWRYYDTNENLMIIEYIHNTIKNTHNIYVTNLDAKANERNMYMSTEELIIYIKNVLPLLESTNKYINQNNELLNKLESYIGKCTFFDKYEYGWYRFTTSERIRIVINMYKDNYTLKNIKMEITKSKDLKDNKANKKMINEKQLLDFIKKNNNKIKNENEYKQDKQNVDELVDKMKNITIITTEQKDEINNNINTSQLFLKMSKQTRLRYQTCNTNYM